MLYRAALSALVVAVGGGLLYAIPTPAAADHTDPRTPLAPTNPCHPPEGIARGEGDWEFIRNLCPNPGSDLKFFQKAGRVWSSSGTLGQADEGHVGQRILRLVNKEGRVKPRWKADHGSANCPTANPAGTLGLQHDAAVSPHRNPRLLIDTTDATGRCHDPEDGGLEIIDISKIHRKDFKPREIHLTRHVGTSHTVTVDATRPWIVYNSSSQGSGAPWIDVLDIRSCLDRDAKTIKQKRKSCRPEVFRILFQPEWAQRVNTEGERVEGTESACHDITAVPGRIYCGNLNSTIVLDVSGLTTKSGAIRGQPLPCKVADGTDTAAKVTDCSELEEDVPQATGWEHVGHVNHPGRPPGQANNNFEVPADEGVAVSHQAAPTPDQRYMFVTDERGGGVVPPGASCSGSPADEFGNGGIHVFDLATAPNIEYALTPEDEKAIFRGDVVVPSPSFCTVHVIQQIPGEQRIVAAYYSQGVKIVDYFVNNAGRISFRETASFTLSEANTWVAEPFEIRRNDDGTRTYFFMASDINRGIDILKWTGPPNPVGSPPPGNVPLNVM